MHPGSTFRAPKGIRNFEHDGFKLKDHHANPVAFFPGEPRIRTSVHEARKAHSTCTSRRHEQSWLVDAPHGRTPFCHRRCGVPPCPPFHAIHAHAGCPRTQTVSSSAPFLRRPLGKPPNRCLPTQNCSGPSVPRIRLCLCLTLACPRIGKKTSPERVSERNKKSAQNQSPR